MAPASAATKLVVIAGATKHDHLAGARPSRRRSRRPKRRSFAASARLSRRDRRRPGPAEVRIAAAARSRRGKLRPHLPPGALEAHTPGVLRLLLLVTTAMAMQAATASGLVTHARTTCDRVELTVTGEIETLGLSRIAVGGLRCTIPSRLAVSAGRFVIGDPGEDRLPERDVPQRQLLAGACNGTKRPARRRQRADDLPNPPPAFDPSRRNRSATPSARSHSAAAARPATRPPQRRSPTSLTAASPPVALPAPSSHSSTPSSASSLA